MTGNLIICPLASGSKGNAIYISDGETAVLLDAGLSGIEIQRRMASQNLSPDDLDAILVTHEHIDHIKGVGVMARRYGLPVHITAKTAETIGSAIGKIKNVRHFEPGKRFRINSLTIRPFSISHDAVDPVGFTFSQNGTKIGVATDLGVATSVVKNHLKECNLVMIEANHDPGMLMNGPYPWQLKQRVKGRTGHLSNDQSGELLQAILHDRLSHVILGHLSEENNTPDHALQTVGKRLNGFRPCLSVACQDVCGELLNVQGDGRFK